MRACVLAASVFLGACCEFSGAHTHFPHSSHYDGEQFHNQIEARVSDWEIVKWRVTRKPGPWRDHYDEPPGEKPPTRVTEGIRVTMVNHATVLIQVDGMNLLTDPVWGEIAGPTNYIGRERHRAPGIRFDDLPPIDAVLISHDHYDHLDMGAMRRLWLRDHPRTFAGLGMAALFRQHGIGAVTELDWFRWSSIGKLRIIGAPARHGCRRGACDENRRLWLSFVVRAPTGDVYFAGDTGYGPHFQQIYDRYGAPAVALLPISPGLPRALFGGVHLDADDAVIAAKVLHAGVSIPIHFGTFSQGDEGDGEAEAKFRKAASAIPFVVLHNGESFTSSRAAGGS